ncbi:hypothetical protein GLOIN_2v1483446 [Rhizophagus irregularis DAOM 181602=DAOM 197198]|uniref:Uncharacterized protein n=2 Tax=Rhizophagus irregularis (strain DAOM 181602 / DAOM 197198 / MUCL 43194) TaxID=747089 RepID=A0A2P4PHV4_RHIID|nr:hypothetical protein GLOIN_2v1483446 [Rhizophagus irregularis DAOM 181602=DAOM 197198]POG64976.1 hypothetical protein GLOIN_2v1483446 [Rhizophagus irregularis DAOM 181602=DAOM 197198]|eukprot:XP_025171842.1 hypothetical protein GLOIN_2v1483446 [Rhizophagus irregularis DAOM 181602=DAOM 197198]
MDEQCSVFFSITQAVTKVLDKIECEDDTFFSKKFPIEIGILSDNSQLLINRTDIFHCVKKEQYGSKSGLTNEVLNLKDKQAAERFFSSNILKVIFDEYTQKEHQKSNNKAANNPKNFVVETENGPIELATALRYERMRANTNLIRTKGRISR